MEFVTVGYEKKSANKDGLPESTYNYLIFSNLGEMTDRQIKKMVTKWLEKQNELIMWHRVYEVYRRTVIDANAFLQDRANFLGHFHLVDRSNNTMTYYEKTGEIGDVTEWETVTENSI